MQCTISARCSTRSEQLIEQVNDIGESEITLRYHGLQLDVVVDAAKQAEIEELFDLTDEVEEYEWVAVSMSFQEAVQLLAKQIEIDDPDLEEKAEHEARRVIARDVRSLVITPHGDGNEDWLGDWIAEGSFEGGETAEQIAAEWDERSRAAEG